MSEWKEYKLVDLCTKIGSGATPRGGGESYKETGISLIRSQNVLDFQFSNSGLAFIDDEQAHELKNVIVKENDVLLNITGDSVARVCKVPKKVLPARVNQHVAIVRSDSKKLNSDFLLYYLQNIKEHLLSISEIGATRRAITKGMIENIEINIPDISEQNSIASILSSLDDKIDLLHRQNATLEKMAETLFRQWFVEEAKEDWEEKTLEDILEFVVDNRGKTAPTSDSGIPLIATNCIKNNNIFPVYEKVRYVSQDTYDNWFRSHPKPGDIIFVNKGTPGCINLVPEPIDFCIAQDMIALRVDKNLVSNFYLFIYLRLETTQADIINSSVGTTIPHLKKTDLLKFTLPVPPIQLMNKFTQSVEPLFLKMNNDQTQIRTLTALRDTLLPKLMSGEVSVEM